MAEYEQIKNLFSPKFDIIHEKQIGELVSISNKIIIIKNCNVQKSLLKFSSQQESVNQDFW